MEDPANQQSADLIFETDHLKADLGRRTARGGAVAIASQILKFLISVSGTAVLARLLTPEDYGLIGMVSIVTCFVSMYKDLGLSTATIQTPKISSKQISTLFWINVGLSLLVTLVCVLIAPLVSRFYGEPRLTRITIVSGVGFLISGLAVQHEALLRRQMRFVAIAIVGVASVLAGYGVGIAMAFSGYKYWSLVVSQLALVSVYAFAVLLVCGWRPGLPRRNSGVRSMIRFGGNLTGFATVNYFSRNSDNLLIGRVWGPQQLGFYSRAYQLMMMPIDQINEPITSVAVPALSRLVDSPQDYRKAYLRILQKIALITIPGVALMIVAADGIVAIMLGPQWREVSLLLIILGISGLFQPVMNTTGWLFITQGRTHHMLQWSYIGGPLTILSIVIGLRWGAVGVATTYVVTQLSITYPLLFWWVGRYGPVKTKDFYVTIAPVALASFCGLGAGYAWRQVYDGHAPIMMILTSAPVVLLTTLVALLIIPAGRHALRDIRETAFMLISSRREVTT